jgi:glycosyltransferase involved in cell wall biosynthesis
MTEKMKINLFTNYAGDAQYSMFFYAAHIEKNLKLYFMNNCKTAIFTPTETSFGKIIRRNSIGRKIDSYWNRFVKHPIIAKKASEGINHITDHNNSYLIKYLDPLRTVITCHDLVYFRNPDKKKNNKFPFLRHTIRKYTVSGLKKAAKIIADSENTKKDIVELTDVPSDNIVVIYPGVRPCFNRIKDAGILSSGRKRLNFRWGKTILHVGENLYYKNIDVILYALKILCEGSGKEIHFVKVGKDFNSEQKDLILKLGIESHVHYMGNLDDSDLNLIYNLSDVLVFPSLYEGFGWPPLEAMACGTPVVCSNKGSLKEVVGDSAIFVEPYDREGFARAILVLMADGEIRQNKIKQGFENIKRFDWKRMTEAVFRVYQEVENGRKNREREKICAA